ncbi:MAG: PAS domain-containing sensor histidine kinase [Phycisphaerae bacterium]
MSLVGLLEFHPLFLPMLGLTVFACVVLLLRPTKIFGTPVPDQTALRSNEARLRAIFDTSPECIKIVDREGRLVSMNEAGLTMIDADSFEQVDGASVYDLVLPPYHDLFRDGIRMALSGERVVQEFEIEGLKGTHRWMEQVSVALPPSSDSDGPPNLVIALTRDVTERKRTVEHLEQARRQAEAADHAKSEFLANMSHEIRTPMTAIMGFTELLESGDLGSLSSDSADAITTIRQNSKHLLYIINDILDMSKIDSGQLKIEKLATCPRQVLLDVTQLLERQAIQKGLELRTVCETPIPARIETDPARLRQILVNLIGNALKFTDRGRVSIHLSADVQQSLMCFKIVDTGIGMSADACQRLSKFEPFSQADTSTTREFGGTGLGLPISSSLCRLLGGELTIESKLGVGSTFTFTIATGSLESIDPVTDSTVFSS